ncbi:MAG: LuxR C-terminal-related transcriptional regulator [Pseudonocardia sp.]
MGSDTGTVVAGATVAGTVADLLRRALAGPGVTVTVGGEAGIGKTHLLDELAALAAARGVRVLRAGAHVDPGAVLAAVRAGAGGPRVVLLDDAQWLDPAAAAGLDALLRAGPPRRTLVAVADRRPAPPWPTDHRVEVGPCGDELTARLLAGLVPAQRTTAARLAGGNPMLLTRLARDGVPARFGDPVPPAVAETVHAEVEALAPADRALLRGAAVAGAVADPELAAAAAGVAGAAGVAALVESGLLVWHGGPGGCSACGSAVGGRDDGSAVGGRDDGSAGGRWDGDFDSGGWDGGSAGEGRGAVCCRRPLVRWAVYAGTGPGWRLAAHARIAAALAARGAPAAEQAVHVERCARPGDEAAALLLIEAAAVAAAPGDAARWYAAALRVLPALATPGRRAGVQAAGAVAAGRAGDLEPARAALRHLDGVPATAVRFDVTAGWLLGRARSTRPVRPGPPAGPLDDAVLRLAAAEQAFVTGEPVRAADVPAADAWAEGAWAAAARAADVRAADARAEGAAADASTVDTSVAGEASFAARVLWCSADLARGRIGEPVDVPAGVLDLPASFWLARLHLLTERFADAERHARHGSQVVARSGEAWLEVAFAAVLTGVLTRTGRLTEAAAVASAAHEAATARRNPHDLAWALAGRVEVAVAAGDLRPALAWGAQAAEHAAALDPSIVLATLPVDLATARLATGAPDALGALRDVPPADLAGVHELRARAALAAGDIATGVCWARRAGEAALEVPLGRPAAAALRARAAVELARDRPAAAAVAAREAATVADAAGLVLDANRARVLAGRALAAAGRRADAVVELRAAHHVLAGCGAGRAADEAVHLLRVLGERPATVPRPPGVDPAAAAPSTCGFGLSPRERAVAELVADGLTNREIAERLFVSAKTVEAHLATTFRKLGVRNRASVAAAVR